MNIWQKGRLLRRWSLHNLLQCQYDTSIRHVRRLSTQDTTNVDSFLIERTRNIGIIAHIDAVCAQITISIFFTISNSISRVKPLPRSVCYITAGTLAELEVQQDLLFKSRFSFCGNHNIDFSYIQCFQQFEMAFLLTC